MDERHRNTHIKQTENKLKNGNRVDIVSITIMTSIMAWQRRQRQRWQSNKPKIKIWSLFHNLYILCSKLKQIQWYESLCATAPVKSNQIIGMNKFFSSSHFEWKTLSVWFTRKNERHKIRTLFCIVIRLSFSSASLHIAMLC